MKPSIPLGPDPGPEHKTRLELIHRQLQDIDVEERSDYVPADDEELTSIGDLPDSVLRLHRLRGILFNGVREIVENAANDRERWETGTLGFTQESLREYLEAQINATRLVKSLMRQAELITTFFQYELGVLFPDREPKNGTRLAVIGRTLYATSATNAHDVLRGFVFMEEDILDMLCPAKDGYQENGSGSCAFET